MNETENSTCSPRLVVIGLDGASWAVLRPLLDAGLLKCLRATLSEGVRAQLESIIPPVTGPAWPVVATGLNPGRLGAFDFYNRQSLDKYDLYPVRSHLVRGRSMWDILAARGYRVGVFNYPMLVPPYEINGWMVAGLGASKAQNWAWPHSLQRALGANGRRYSISLSYGLPKYRDNLDLLLNDLDRMLAERLNALEYLLDKTPVDVLIAVFSVTDFVSHTMWHLWDTTHPLHDELEASEVLPKVHRLWSKVDKSVERILGRLAPSGHALIVSDHGFGPSYGVFHTNQWLEQNGYLKRRSGASSLSNRIRSKLVSMLSPALEPLFTRIQGTRTHLVLRESILREIDLSETKAFALETTDVCGMIFINREYAHLHGLDETQFVEQTTLAIQNHLRQYAQETGLDVEVFSSEELYVGEKSRLAPEILFKVKDFEVSISYRFSPIVYETRLHHQRKTGNHRQEGVFIAYGPKIRRGVQASPFSVLDIAPTVFHLLGEPVPRGLDGRVAVEACLPDYQQVAYTAASDETAMPTDGEAFDGAEGQDEMRRRLRALGYID